MITWNSSFGGNVSHLYNKMIIDKNGTSEINLKTKSILLTFFVISTVAWFLNQSNCFLYIASADKRRVTHKAFKMVNKQALIIIFTTKFFTSLTKPPGEIFKENLHLFFLYFAVLAINEIHLHPTQILFKLVQLSHSDNKDISSFFVARPHPIIIGGQVYV